MQQKREPNSGSYKKGERKPGQGNPNIGRVSRNRSLLFKLTSDEELEAVWKKMLDKAARGNVNAARMVLEYVAGKPSLEIELGGKNGRPIQIEAVRRDIRRIMEDPQLFENAQKLLSHLPDAINESGSSSKTA